MMISVLVAYTEVSLVIAIAALVYLAVCCFFSK